MKDWFADNQIKQRSDVGLYNKEEDLFRRYIKKSRANDDVRGIGPYSSMYQMRIPRGSREKCNLVFINRWTNRQPCLYSR